MGVTVRYEGGMRFVGESASGRAIAMDAPADSGGTGSEPTPVELLLNSIGGCTGMDIVYALRKMRTPATGLTIRIEERRASSFPRVVTNVHLDYEIAGEIPEENARRAVELSLSTYCTVSNSLACVGEITHAVRVVPS
ncbi:MAG: OsmC family protein [Candidatus Bipolaricaulota bacterium]|nr:MAG: OsmC family protein [Candidatus Bipolaricaulota bacterium]